MKVYLAAAYSARDILWGWLKPELESRGHEVTSSWLDERHELTAGSVGAALDASPEYLRKHIAGDILDVARSDVLVLLTGSFMAQAGIPGPLHTGGRHVETGVALALDIPVVVLGPPENIFHRGSPSVAGLVELYGLLETMTAQPINQPQTQGAQS